MPSTATYDVPGIVDIHALSVEKTSDFQPTAGGALNSIPLRTAPNDHVASGLDSLQTAIEEEKEPSRRLPLDVNPFLIRSLIGTGGWVAGGVVGGSALVIAIHIH